MCVWWNASVPGELFRWKVKRWESLSCRQCKVAPNRADRLTSTHPHNHKELGLYLLTAAAGGRVCEFGHMCTVPSRLLHQSKHSDGQIKTSRLHNASYMCWEKLQHQLWPDPSHFRFLSAWEPLSVYNPVLSKRNSSGGIRSRCPYAEFLSSVCSSGGESEQHGKQRQGLFRHWFAPPWHPGNVPMAILSYFYFLFRTSQAVCGSEVWNREGLCSGNVKKRSWNVKRWRYLLS